MSDDIAIRVENLGKMYRIGRERERPHTLLGRVGRTLSSPFDWLSSQLRPPAEDEILWALKDVSLEVKRGEVIGIIGRNGAGKSTLLKILSRITEPSTGRAEIHGRVASLLEVGTGMHPELTGRENIYLNGCILGMRKAEIDSKFDEIVNFSGVEKFIDTPVKRYSSGMHVRLGFAIAAHLEPEILIIDEVLAVGDAEFQKRCLGKMEEVAGTGRTVLFVSHSMSAVSVLCPRCVLFEKGCIAEDGATESTVEKYFKKGTSVSCDAMWTNPGDAPGNNRVRLHRVRIVSEGRTTGDVDIQKEVRIEIEFWNFIPGAKLSSSIHLLDKYGSGILASGTMPSACLSQDKWFGSPHPVGLFRATCALPGNFLNEGVYSVNAIVLSKITEVEARADSVVSFRVFDSGAMRKEYTGSWLGVVRPKLGWATEFVQSPNGDDRGEG